MTTSKREGARVVELDPSDDGIRTPRQARSAAPHSEPGTDEQTLAEFLYTLVESRILIACVAAAALALGVGYVVFAAPTYRTDVLLQVEDKTKSVAGLDDLSTMFSDKAPADAEMEIIRSRSLIGSVVDELNLTVEARPRLFPIFGGAFFRRYDDGGVASSKLGMRSFAWGGERINVSRLHVPDDLLDQKLRLVAGEEHRFTLQGPAARRWSPARWGSLPPLVRERIASKSSSPTSRRSRARSSVSRSA